jgi:hypothetical protein
MSKSTKEKIITMSYLDGNLISTQERIGRVYQRKDGEYVHYVTFYRKIERIDGVATLKVFGKTIKPGP